MIGMDAWRFGPPVLVGERVVWLGSGCGVPQPGVVRWIGKLPEISPDWAIGLELDKPMPYGGIDGTWGKRRLFSCQQKHGLIVPVDKVMKETSLLQARHSVGNNEYGEAHRKSRSKKYYLSRQLSSPPVVQSNSPKEFLSRVLPQPVKRSDGSSTTSNDSGNSACDGTTPTVVPLSIENLRFHQNAFEKDGRKPSYEISKKGERSRRYSKKRFPSLEQVIEYESDSKSNEIRNVRDLKPALKLGVDHKSNEIRYQEELNPLRWSSDQATDKNHLETKAFSEALKQLETFKRNVEFSQKKTEEYAFGKKGEVLPEALKQLDQFQQALQEMQEKRDTKCSNVSRPPKSLLESAQLKKETIEGLDIFQKLGETDLVETTSMPETARATAMVCDGLYKAYVTETEVVQVANSDEEKSQFVELHIGEHFLDTSQPTPTLRKKKEPRYNPTPVPRTRNRPQTDDEKIESKSVAAIVNKKNEAASKNSGNGVKEEDDAGWQTARELIDDTAAVLYEPAFLREWKESEQDADGAMTEVRERFRKIEDEDSFETAVESLSSEPLKRQSSRSGKDRGLFSFLKWFRREKEARTVVESPASVTSSPLFLRSRVSSCGSIDTLFSIATVSSFAFVPAARRPVPAQIPVTPDPPRHRPPAINLIEKYKIFPTDSVRKSCDIEGTLTLGRRRKRKAPEPPSRVGDTSLPNTLEHRRESEEDTDIVGCHHRRTVSESFKDKRAGAYCHVQGKRKAPKPPATAPPLENLYPSLGSLKNQYPSFGKKRPAPPPPEQRAEDVEEPEAVPAAVGCEEISQGVVEGGEKVACTDTLRLERGMLKPNRPDDEKKADPDVTKVVAVSPVSPRPWYKRHRESTGVSIMRRDIFKSLDKKKPKEEEWMPEVGFSRPAVHTESVHSKFNIFARLERNEEKKKEDKRKSQISMLANISELDREAAEILKKEHEQQQEKQAADDAKFYAFPEDTQSPAPEPELMEIPRRNSARELISLFNAISSGPRTTINTSFFTKDNGKQFFDQGNSPAQQRRTVEIKTANVIVTRQYRGHEDERSTDRRQELRETEQYRSEQSLGRGEGQDVGDESTGRGQGLYETGQYRREHSPGRAQALYEARVRRHHSPSPPFSTITEMTESASSVGTTPASTINSSGIEKVPTTWTCWRCTLENPRWRMMCEACNNLRSYSRHREDKLEKRKSEMDFMIDWEEELKKYFPEKKDKKEPTPECEISAKLTLSKEGDVVIKTDRVEVPKQPGTFLGRSVVQDVNKEDITTCEEGGGDPKEDLDEVRKKRLAFFNKTQPSEQQSLGSVRDAAAKESLCETEKMKLKEMLKEMKNSLPKNEKVFKNTSTSCSPNGDVSKEAHPTDALACEGSKREVKMTTGNESNVREVQSSNSSPAELNRSDAEKYGAIKKIRQPVNATGELPKKGARVLGAPEELVGGPSRGEDPTQDTVAEALLVTTTTVYEDVIIRKKPQRTEKVSSGVQTSAVVKKSPRVTCDDVTPYVLPVTVQHFSTVGLRDGVPYTSPKKARSIGNGNFELIRARDLASIVRTKTGNSYPATVTHEYANCPSSPPNCVFAKENGVLCVQEEGDAGDSGGAGEEDDAWSEGQASEVERLTTQLTNADGLADFKADIQACPPDTNMNTLSVNRLLRRLEAAIAGGQHVQAAVLAKDLACLKITCSVTRHKKVDPLPSTITLDMYVEDKVSHQGPIPLQVPPSMTVLELKQKVERDLEIPVGVQRWILGKQLAGDDCRSLEHHGVTVSGCPIFLYLVAPDPEEEIEDNATAMAPEQTVDQQSNSDEPRRPPMGKGWYYNYEEDRYSFCEDSDAESVQDEKEEPVEDKPVKAEAVRIIQRTIEAARSKSKSLTPPKKEEDDEESKVLVKEPLKPRRRSSHELPRPEIKDTLKKDLKVISVNAVKDTITRLTHIAATKHDRSAPQQQPSTSTGTLTLGWKCPVCTLVNPPTRPGCAACTAERPLGYVIPSQYRANEVEMSRIQREQHVDSQLKTEETATGGRDKGTHYMELMNLDNADLVPNTVQFECPVCLVGYKEREGITLRDCLHTFCRMCLAHTVEFNEEAEIKCPYRDDKYACDSVLQEREIKALVPRPVYEQHLAKSVSLAENKIGNAFHCKTPDCTGWCILEDNVNEFRCPVCSQNNCLTCHAVHDGANCRQYQERMRQAAETDVDAKRTRHMLEEMVEKGEAMACPTCQVVLMKKWGCDWLRCSMCKTEICWVTRGPRWGPAGKGDMSGGCQCGVNGVKCHPKCNYCH